MKTKKYNRNWTQLSGYNQQEINDNVLRFINYRGTRNKMGRENYQRIRFNIVETSPTNIKCRTGLERFINKYGEDWSDRKCQE